LTGSIASRFFSLSRTDKRLLVQATLYLGIIRIWLWLFSFSRVEKLVDFLVDHYPAGSSGKYPVGRIPWGINQAGRLIPRSTCLVRALATQVFLAGCGYPSSLCIGVAKGGEAGFEAHAWVEMDGRAVIGEPEPSHYTLLMTRERRVR
jgi:hypothetical protein